MWIRALEGGTIGPDGGGGMARMVRECRGHAAVFLGEIADHFGPGPHVHLARVRDLYQKVADTWTAYLKLFPGMSSAPSAWTVSTPQDRSQALAAVRSACEAESRAIAELEAALGFIP